MNKLIFPLLLFSIVVLGVSEKGDSRKIFYRQFSERNQPTDKLHKLLILYKDSLDYAKGKQNVENTAFYSLIISKIYYKLGGYNNSIDYSKIALKKYKELKDTSFTMLTLLNMGAIYGGLGEKDIALDYFKQIEELALKSKDTIALAYNYNNMGLIYSDKDYKKALEYFDKIDELLPDKRKSFKVHTYNSRALIYYNLHQYDKAVNIFKKILPIIDSNSSFYSSICTNIALAYKNMQKTDSSLKYCYKALAINPEYHSLNNFANTYSLMTGLYVNKNMPDSINKYLELYKAYNDSVVIKQKAEYVSKLKVIYETDKLIDEIKSKKHEIEKSHSKIVTMSVIIIIFSIALIVFIILYRKLQLSYKQIVRQSVNSLKIEDEYKKLKQKIAELNAPVKPKTVNIEKIDELFSEIIRLMEEDKLFLDEDFDVNKLADKLNTNRTYISKIINGKTGDSFVKFVNTYRVNEAKRLLLDEKNKKLTLEAIGKLSGFKSSATFYRVFKLETGVTPSFFVKNKNG